VDARFDFLNANIQAFLCNTANALCFDAGFANDKHLGGITMIIVFDNRNIDIDNIPFFEFFFAGYAVTDNIVNAGAN
jgi:hypothetical protein